MTGDQTRVSVDRWIPSLPSGHPTHLVEVETRGSLVVSFLIDQENSAWHMDSISALLSPADHDAILATLIGDPLRNDYLV